MSRRKNLGPSEWDQRDVGSFEWGKESRRGEKTEP